MERKNTMLLTVIAVATLLVAVVGATFAYYNVVSSTDNTTRNVNVTTEEMGAITQTTPVSNLKIVTAVGDFAASTKGVNNYYAVPADSANNYALNTAQNHEISKAQVAGGAATAKYHCDATIKVTVGGTMADKLATTDADLILTPGANTKLNNGTVAVTTHIKDIQDATNNTMTFDVDYDFVGIQTGLVTGDVVLHNTEHIQNGTGEGNSDIDGSALTLTINTDTFTCDTVQ